MILKSIISLVTRPGFEPRQAESESAVLPLYYRALKSANLNLMILFLKYKSFINIRLLLLQKPKNHFNINGILVLHQRNNDDCQRNRHCC